MTLAPGTCLGPYEIDVLIGHGGTGEVYRARDPRLDRVVAIKTLRAHLSTDPEHLRRFEREARAASALNHPNILTIYDIGREGETAYIAMEWVDGTTLRDVMAEGRLPIRQLLKIAQQIAGGLAKAHGAGIIHRDLKPANVMITADGLAKIVDFGLAKLVVPPNETDSVTHSAGTLPGIVMGTLGYMSPEQANAGPIDHRADQFAFGVIVYEMATANRPFLRDTVARTLAATIDEDPTPIRELNAKVPEHLAAVVDRCLAKDRLDRYDSTRDLARDVQQIDTPSVLVAAPFRSRTTGPRSRRRLELALVGLGLALGLAAFVMASRSWRAASVQRASLDRLQIRQLTSTGNALWPAVSPDGKYVAYIQRDGSDYSLWVRQTTSASNVEIVPPSPGVMLLGATVTPDGSFVDFVRYLTGGNSVELWRVPFLGGATKRLIDNVDSLVDWSPTGQRIAFVRSSPLPLVASYALVVADADGSHERVLAVREGTAGFFGLSIIGRPRARPAWAPDGQTIAVSAFDLKAGADTNRIVFVDEATGSETTLTGNGWGGLAWLNGASLVLSGSMIGPGPGQLSLLSYPAGKASRLTNDLNSYDGISLTSDRSALVTTRTERRAGVWVGDALASSGTEIIPAAAVEASGYGQGIAWAGDRLLYSGSGGAIMSIVPGRGSPSELVSAGLSPAATSDGRSIVYVAFGPAGPGFWRADADGGHARQLLGELAGSPVVTRDDRQVIFLSLRSGIQSPWIMPIEGGTPMQVVNVLAGSLSLSPDGTSIMIGSVDDQNRTIVIVCELPACTSRRSFMSTAADLLVRWTPDGRGIAYVDGSTQSNLWVQPLDGTSQHQLTHFIDGRTIADFAWSRDGKRLAITRSMVTNDIVLFNGLQ